MFFMTIVTVITNIGVVLFTDDTFGLSSDLTWLVFIIAEHGILFLIIVIREIIPD